MTIRPRLRPEEDGFPAGFVTRLIAMAIDLALLSLVITTLTVLGQFVGRSLGVGTWTLRFIALGTTLFGAALYVLYFVGLVVLGGQTLGKRLMGIRVLRTDGTRVRLKRSVIRYIGTWLSLPLFWGYLWVLIDNRRQTFHDKLADTIVIYYTIPPNEIGPLEQYLRALRLRREERLAAIAAAAQADADIRTGLGEQSAPVAASANEPQVPTSVSIATAQIPTE
jgi:uncharacterized RDD family membrane protein YckC